MSNLDTRLRQTFDRVAESTKVRRRADEIVQDRRRRPLPRFTVAVAAFAVVAGIFALPMLLGGSPTNDVAGGFAAPDEDTESSSPSDDATGGSTAPDHVAQGTTPPENSPVIIDPDWLTVEADDVAAFNGIPLPGDGERASLRSETVWCFYEEGRPIETRVSGVAVDQPISADDLTSTCATDADSTASDLSTDSMTVCRGVFDPAFYQEWASSGEYTVISGGVEGSHPGFPVILAWQADCNTQTVTSHPTITVTDDLSLEAVNRARQLELAAVAAAIQNCLSYDESQALASAIAGELGQQWMHTSMSGSDGLTGGCFQPFIDQQWGWVFTDIIRDEQPPPVTETTLAPTSP